MMRNIKSEEDVQRLIFDYPWLLDINFERIPSKEINDGWEVQLAEQNRIDLLLNHRVSKRPVIIEFKKGYFYRENIGQLLDYRARILNEIHNSTSKLKELFGDNLFVPILCLVVKECDDFSRTACNLSGIQVFEYKNIYTDVHVPIDVTDFDKLSATLANNDIPFHRDRCKDIEEKLYIPLKEILRDLGLEDGWSDFRRPTGEYITEYNKFFINKWLFDSGPISIGIYEDLFKRKKMVIDFFSYNEENMLNFINVYETESLFKGEYFEFPQWGEFYYTLLFSREDFMRNKEHIFRSILTKYKDIMRSNFIDK